MLAMYQFTSKIKPKQKHYTSLVKKLMSYFPWNTKSCESFDLLYKFRLNQSFIMSEKMDEYYHWSSGHCFDGSVTLRGDQCSWILTYTEASLKKIKSQCQWLKLPISQLTTVINQLRSCVNYLLKAKCGEITFKNQQQFYDHIRLAKKYHVPKHNVQTSRMCRTAPAICHLIGKYNWAQSDWTKVIDGFLRYVSSSCVFIYMGKAKKWKNKDIVAPFLLYDYDKGNVSMATLKKTVSDWEKYYNDTIIANVKKYQRIWQIIEEKYQIHNSTCSSECDEDESATDDNNDAYNDKKMIIYDDKEDDIVIYDDDDMKKSSIEPTDLTVKFEQCLSDSNIEDSSMEEIDLTTGYNKEHTSKAESPTISACTQKILANDPNVLINDLLSYGDEYYKTFVDICQSILSKVSTEFEPHEWKVIALCYWVSGEQLYLFKYNLNQLINTYNCDVLKWRESFK